jgi:hypothetical protein
VEDKDAKAKAAGLLEKLKKGPLRRFRAHLCGLNHTYAGPTTASLLEESRTAEAYSSYPSGFQRKAACVWSVKLAPRPDQLDHSGNEQQCVFHPISTAPVDPAISTRASGFGDEYFFLTQECSCFNHLEPV